MLNLGLNSFPQPKPSDRNIAQIIQQLVAYLEIYLVF